MIWDFLKASSPGGKMEPLRAELLSGEQLTDEAKRLASLQKIGTHKPRPELLDRIQENDRYLNDIYKVIKAAISAGEAVPPAEEWIFDNFHFVSEQLRNIHEDLPRNFYKELPSLDKGPFQGLPRVFEMAMQVISHTDNRLSMAILTQYIHAFQEISVLTTGELWGFAIFLRIGLVENLRRLIHHSELDRQARMEADQFVNRQLTEDLTTSSALLSALKEPQLSRADRAFAAQLVGRLRDRGSEAIPVLNLVLERVSREGLSPDDLIREAHQDLAATQVSVSNSILSLRLLAAADWSEVVEETSLVDTRLRKDPSGFYDQCDFATRDRYRHVVESISKRSKLTEIEITDIVLELANSAEPAHPDDVRRKHVGYYLIDKGRKRLEELARFRAGPLLTIRRVVENYPFLFYQFPIGLLTVYFLFVIARYCVTYSDNLLLVCAALLLFCPPVSGLSVALVNWAVTLLKAPVPLPKLDLKDGIPAECKTIVVIPALLNNSTEIRELAERLEVHYLANSDELLDFALLSDYVDSDSEVSDEDNRLLQEVTAAISNLNRKYPRSRGPRFHVYHRFRKWNEAEGKWMGWERKRGKLEEFNRLLLGDTNTSFLPASVPSRTQFVITLDSDTILPRDSARKLIGTLAHPLNRARVDSQIGHVLEGYGILQPRISHTLTSANRTWFSRAFSGPTGIDPYTTAVSDIYQDLFHEASFVGKGIYDLRAFDACLRDRFPENILLSHDLIEGAYARTGLVSDVELFDDHPSDYITYMMRSHRWVRGDWQILEWLGRFVRRADNSRAVNTLSWLNRWKLLDNLRRSLVSPFALLGLIAGWTILPGTAVFWTLLITATLFAPILLQLISGGFTRAKTTTWASHAWAVLYETRISLLQTLIKIAFLADEAIAVLDAIFRTLYRMFRKQKLLEWMTAALAEKARRGRNLQAYLRRMFPTQVLAVASIVLIEKFRPDSMVIAFPFLLVWLLSPLIAYLTGKNIHHKENKLPEIAIPYFRGIARDIWRYYETFVGERDNWLPPDNFQESPENKIAHRTSPTNIGFLLLSNMVAFDLGYISSSKFTERTEQTLSTLSRLKSFNGHFYNWYETETLTPLEPRYVSTVDSGNLAASLIVLKQFAMKFPQSDYPRREVLYGIRDTLQKLFGSATKVEFPLLRKELAGLTEIPEDVSARESLLNRLAKTAHMENPGGVEEDETQFWWNALDALLRDHLADSVRSHDLASRLSSIAEEAELLVEEMDFKFMFNESNGLFSIGFNVSNGQLDNSYYDLLASESRLTSFIAIAKGDVPQSHWFRLARTMTSIGSQRVLASWSGSMFEFLMPLLFVRNEPNTLLDETSQEAVALHQLYGKEKHLPWGISEAGYNARDVSMNYQYGPFGVPGLGLKGGLEKDYVAAPYATFLAGMIDPVGAIHNLEQLEQAGVRGKYGFYESMDYSQDRIPEGATGAVVQSYMAHHQGMSLVAIANMLERNIIQKRFHQDPHIRATELLIQERMPGAVRSAPVQIMSERVEFLSSSEPIVAREFLTHTITPPRTQILSNGSYLVTVTTGGSGFSQCRGLQISRWREDFTRDDWGTFIYLKDSETQKVWSAGFQPTVENPSYYHVSLAEDRVEIRRRDGQIETNLDITVSPEENAEVRRLAIVNASPDPKELDVASYLEIVLALPLDDLAHPAFSNLFVETEFIAEMGVLVARRKSRSGEGENYWAAHVMMSEADESGELQYETNRRNFIGRGGSMASPAAFRAAGHTNTAGAVLDPIFSLRRKIKVPAFGRAVVAFTTLLAASREELISAAGKYREPGIVNRTFELSATHSQLLLKELSLSSEDAQAFQRLAGRLLYVDPSLRPRPPVLTSNKRTQAALWPYGISGDVPICLVRIEDKNEMGVVRQLLRAHEYWRLKGFTVDLVILNEYPSSYFQELQEDLLSEIRSGPSQAYLNQSGGIYLIRADLIPEEDRVLLRTVARAQIVAGRGTLARQLARVEPKSLPIPNHVPSAQYPIRDPDFEIGVPPLQLGNDFGGFSMDGTEYKIVLREGVHTPAPWINVISNSRFGFQISESGAGMTWSENSRENRLTPWSNDPVLDPVDCALYIRDEESGAFWSPTPSPARATGTYIVTHGAGYTHFQCGAYGIEQELSAFVAVEEPVKILKLRLRNQTKRTRWLSVTHYAELLLGIWRGHSAPFVSTQIDDETGALLATNSYNNEFAGRVVFSSVNHRKRTVTGDRTFFLGPNGSLTDPAAMRAAYLSGRVGAGLDPCHALQSTVKLDPLGEHTVVFLLGEGRSIAEARSLISRFQQPEDAEREMENVRRQWDEILGKLQINTPDPAMNILCNRWLLYQTLSCRIWGRTALYQSGGAYGFRDQLQDAMALVYTAPELLREHLVRAASRQFPEGDVQHWWHPPTGRGVRTKSSDDLLWLPYALLHYVQVTGDETVLDEQVSFINGPQLKPEETEAYFQPSESANSASLYDHCTRAIDHSLKLGEHGLPLIGSGDWNDGMNRIGVLGRGESVWLGWFLVKILNDFAMMCEHRCNKQKAADYIRSAKNIAKSIEASAWDGEWYLRAFHDDGTRIGSKDALECQIDSIAQSWAALSGGGNRPHVQWALNSVYRRLLLANEKLVLLFTPPFAESQMEPGYIKSYPPGIRENGGHYSHAGAWLAAAFAESGLVSQAHQTFQFLNPMNHSTGQEEAVHYRLEPYVVAADVYANPAYMGMGGWSWYTGSAAWIYRVAVEWLLGLRMFGDYFTLQPCIPREWKKFEITYRHGKSTFHILVENGIAGKTESRMMEIDGMNQPDCRVALDQTAGEHRVRLRLGSHARKEASPAPIIEAGEEEG